MKTLERKLTLIRMLAIIVTLFLILGCATSRGQFYRSYGDGITPSGRRVFLSSPREILFAIETFTHTNYIDEVGKINYLLSRMRSSSYRFIRNGHVYTGDKGAMWLRWKMHSRYLRKHPVKTAQQFIHTVANGSLQSGLPYLIEYPDGTRHRLESILENELWALEKHLASRKLMRVGAAQPGATPVANPFAARPIYSQN